MIKAASSSGGAVRLPELSAPRVRCARLRRVGTSSSERYQHRVNLNVRPAVLTIGKEGPNLYDRARRRKLVLGSLE
jgi:hypothetical protein